MHVKARKQRVLRRSDNLFMESGRHWGAIVSHSYDFGRPERVAEAMDRLSLRDLLEFYDRYLDARSPERRKLVTWAKGAKAGGGEGVGSSPGGGPSDLPREAVTDGTGQGPCRRSGGSMGERELVVVENLEAFHRRMPLLPFWSPSAADLEQPAAQ